MSLNKMMAVILLSIPLASNAANITYVYSQNPAYVTATLDVSCDKALENLEKTASKVFGDIPYVANARLMSPGQWKEETKTDTYVTATKTLAVSVSPTLTKEFPTTFIPASVRKTTCLPQKGTTACVGVTYVTIEGAKAVIYQKVTEATKVQNWMKSFNGSMTFTVAGADSCVFQNSLSISDNSYLWAKKHLIKEIDPTLIEGRILGKFIDWGKNILPAMEAK